MHLHNSALSTTHMHSLFWSFVTRCISSDGTEKAPSSQAIEYVTDSSLTEFFSQFLQAPPQLCGVGTTVSAVSDKEAQIARTHLNLDSSTRMLKMTVPCPGDTSLILIFPAPVATGLPLIGCATWACPAFEYNTRKLVFFKDTWRVNFDGILCKGITYEKLNRAGVLNILKCIASGDVTCTVEQKTQMRVCSARSWVCPTGSPLVAHVHYWLVLDIIGMRLTTFSSVHKLVSAIHDALVGMFFSDMILLFPEDCMCSPPWCIRKGWCSTWRYQCGKNRDLWRDGDLNWLGLGEINQPEWAQTNNMHSALWSILTDGSYANKSPRAPGNSCPLHWCVIMRPCMATWTTSNLCFMSSFGALWCTSQPLSPHHIIQCLSLKHSTTSLQMVLVGGGRSCFFVTWKSSTSWRNYFQTAQSWMTYWGIWSEFLDVIMLLVLGNMTLPWSPAIGCPKVNLSQAPLRSLKAMKLYCTYSPNILNNLIGLPTAPLNYTMSCAWTPSARTSLLKSFPSWPTHWSVMTQENQKDSKLMR